MKHSPGIISPECLTDAYVALDKNWCFTYMNNKAGKIFNRHPKKIIGKHIWTEFPEDIDQPIYKAYHKAMSVQQSIDLREYHPRQDKWFDTQICPSPQGLSIFFKDITKGKDAEKALKRSEIRYRRLFESAKDGILILDADTGKIVDANQFLLSLIEFSEKELLGKELWEIGIFKDIVASKEAFKLLQEKKYIYYDDLPLQCKTGKVIDVEFVSNVYKEEDKKVIQCNIRVITERKLAAAEIKNANKQLKQLTTHLQYVLEEERKRIGREIHDELGQQLTAIKMDVVWIDNKTSDDLTTTKSKLKNIILQLDNTNLSIRNILNELRPAVLDNYSLVNELKWQGHQFTENTGIPLSFKSSPKKLKIEQEVSIMLFRIFQEAITNIKKYANAKKVTIALKYSDNMLVLKIKDNGKGFNTELLKTKQSFGILGMKERVTARDGIFELISSPGKGTEVITSIPLIL